MPPTSDPDASDPTGGTTRDLMAEDERNTRPLPARLPPLSIVIATAVVAVGAISFSLRPAVAGTWVMWLGLAVPYLLLAAYAAYLMYDDGTLFDRLKPRGGDFTLGVLVSVALLVGSWSLRAHLAPAGSAWQGWVARIYLIPGDPSVLQRSSALTITLLAVAGLQEITWRGMVQDAMTRLVGDRRAWILTALLFAAVSLPTALTLSDPIAGPNPLLVLAALGCGLAWGFLTRMAGRLWPAMFAHMVFAYFTAVQFHIPGVTPAPM